VDDPAVGKGSVRHQRNISFFEGEYRCRQLLKTKGFVDRFQRGFFCTSPPGPKQALATPFLITAGGSLALAKSAANSTQTITEGLRWDSTKEAKRGG